MAARLTQPIPAAGHPHSRSVYVVKVTLCLVDQGVYLRTLERDRWPLGVVLIVGIGVRRGVDDLLEGPA